MRPPFPRLFGRRHVLVILAVLYAVLGWLGTAMAGRREATSG